MPEAVRAKRMATDNSTRAEIPDRTETISIFSMDAETIPFLDRPREMISLSSIDRAKRSPSPRSTVRNDLPLLHLMEERAGERRFFPLSVGALEGGRALEESEMRTSSALSAGSAL